MYLPLRGPTPGWRTRTGPGPLPETAAPVACAGFPEEYPATAAPSPAKPNLVSIWRRSKALDKGWNGTVLKWTPDQSERKMMPMSKSGQYYKRISTHFSSKHWGSRRALVVAGHEVLYMIAGCSITETSGRLNE
jgi:hypothetical protein